MGPAATVDFYRRIVESTAATRDQDHVPVLIDGLPDVPDRTAFLLGRGSDPTSAIVRKAVRLEAAGADFLVIACNTAYAFAASVEAAVRIPLIDVPTEVASYIEREGLGLRRVGLLATTGTVDSGMYQEALSRFEIEAIVPTSIDQEELVMAAIQGASGVKTGGNLNAARRLIGRAGRDLIGREAEALLLACTELSLLYPPRILGWNVPVIDAAQVAAERVIVLAEREVKDAAVQP